MKQLGRFIEKEIKFKKSERRVLTVLLLILLCFYTYKLFVYPKLPPPRGSDDLGDILVHSGSTQLDNTKIKDQLESSKNTLSSEPITKEKINNNFKNSSDKNANWKKAKSKKLDWHKKKPKKLVEFDPNGLDSVHWIEMGLKPWTVSNILKYQTKGGRFYNCNDLSKIYSLDDNLLQQILPYCQIKNQPTKNMKASDKSLGEKKAAKINVNTASKAELISLYGIGPVLSERIIKYRDLLGGFHHLSQLNEVYGLEPETLRKIEDKIFVSGPIKKMNLNTNQDSLYKHPYIDYKLAKLIGKYKKHHGPYTDISQLKNIKILNNENYSKLEPYLSVE